MRKARITIPIMLTATALTGLAVAGLNQATAAPTERTITREFTAAAGDSIVFSDAGPGSQSTAIDATQNSGKVAVDKLHGQVVATKKTLNARAGVKSVRTDCDDISTKFEGPNFSPSPNPSIRNAFGHVFVQGSWSWNVTAKQTCTFVLVR